ncbi:sodium/calcium exchanger 2-like isoform X2 [Gigantopelta aegis]|uniref:sodium/calcium exchanger 2-like isoform X2 n=1 Tax=Gigantopelta aegis TaxID=1735272 RepID=UPI001B88B516|nr:sodium/calcium exchanger 2-like isoform X2 [Gigantopelta aegis]
MNINNYTCSDKGLVFPVINEYTWHVGVRATFYLVFMLWCFLGIAIVSDMFMCGIERITSKTRHITVPSATEKDSVEVIEVKVWNDTVANLSLLAFGTSAPEILLSVIEICGKGFKAGDLGPGTIVGSAAFNLLVITAVCIFAIPNGEVRRIKNIQVYGVTSFSSMFAYIWMLIILIVSSPGVIEIWEASVTLCLFPVLIVVAFAMDKGCLSCRKNKTSTEVEIGLALAEFRNASQRRGTADIIDIARECAQNSDLSLDDAAQIAAARIVQNQPHTAAWYRVNATRNITGGTKLIPTIQKDIHDMYDNPRMDEEGERSSSDILSPEDANKAVVEFAASSCAVLENEGYVRLGIRRTGNMDILVNVWVETIDGSAEADSDYKPIKQKITFQPKEKVKDLYVEIIDDDIWEPDEFFFVKLILDPNEKNDNVILGKTSINQVTIINDDEPGKFEFSKPSYVVKESADTAQLFVNRVNGADGEVGVTWETKDMTAVSGKEYRGGSEVLIFKHGETSKTVNIPMYGIQPGQHEPNFEVTLTDPTAGAEIGKIPRCIVTIITDEEFNAMVTRLAIQTQRNLESLSIESGSWREQFHNAMNVNGGNAKGTTAIDYIMHFTTFFWKVLFACIPPPSIGGGWLTFFLSLAMIGILTAIISDVASIFGCLVGLSDTITAITFVALGTSMPDTFASKQAALMEKVADSSIGNVNGSNSVNVFLGLGLPWFIASVFWATKGEVFEVPRGSLVFSVIIYTCCSVVAVILLMIRRRFKMFGQAELGGPLVTKVITALIFFSMWIFYIIISALYAQKIITVNI